MKLRLSHQALRFRLSVEDAITLKDHGQLVETIALPMGESISFGIDARADVSQAQIRVSEQCWWVQLPRVPMQEFLSANHESWTVTLATRQGALTLSLEKDLPCEPCDSPAAPASASGGKRFKKSAFAI